MNRIVFAVVFLAILAVGVGVFIFAFLSGPAPTDYEPVETPGDIRAVDEEPLPDDIPEPFRGAEIVSEEPVADMGTLSGTAIRGDTGGKVEKARVYVLGERRRVRIVRIAEGRFSRKLPAGGYEAIVWMPRKYKEVTASFTIRKDETHTWDLVLDPVEPEKPVVETPSEPANGTVTGIVTDASTGAPLIGVRIEFHRYGFEPEETVSGGEGRYRITIPVRAGLKPAPSGTYQVIVRKFGQYSKFSDYFTAHKDKTVSLDIELERLKSGTYLAGKVTDYDTGEPIPNAGLLILSISKPPGSGSCDSLNASNDGSFSYEAEAGRYEILAGAGGYLQARIEAVAIEGVTRRYEIRLKRSATIQGYVTDAGGGRLNLGFDESHRPILPSVYCIRPMPYPSVATDRVSTKRIRVAKKDGSIDATGFYKIVTEPGEYYVIATAPGYEPAVSGKIALSPEGLVDCSLALDLLWKDGKIAFKFEYEGPARKLPGTLAVEMTRIAVLRDESGDLAGWFPLEGFTPFRDFRKDDRSGLLEGKVPPGDWLVEVAPMPGVPFIVPPRLVRVGPREEKTVTMKVLPVPRADIRVRISVEVKEADIESIRGEGLSVAAYWKGIKVMSMGLPPNKRRTIQVPKGKITFVARTDDGVWASEPAEVDIVGDGSKNEVALTLQRARE